MISTRFHNIQLMFRVLGDVDPKDEKCCMTISVQNGDSTFRKIYESFYTQICPYLDPIVFYRVKVFNKENDIPSMEYFSTPEDFYNAFKKDFKNAKRRSISNHYKKGYEDYSKYFSINLTDISNEEILKILDEIYHDDSLPNPKARVIYSYYNRFQFYKMINYKKEKIIYSITKNGTIKQLYEMRTEPNVLSALTDYYTSKEFVDTVNKGKAKFTSSQVCTALTAYKSGNIQEFMHLLLNYQPDHKDGSVNTVNLMKYLYNNAKSLRGWNDSILLDYYKVIFDKYIRGFGEMEFELYPDKCVFVIYSSDPLTIESRQFFVENKKKLVRYTKLYAQFIYFPSRNMKQSLEEFNKSKIVFTPDDKIRITVMKK